MNPPREFAFVPTHEMSHVAIDSVFKPITLPCGISIQNRLVKVAMYEHLASFMGGPPNEYHLRLYSEWAKHDWGMVVTGNVQIFRDHLTLGRDLVLPSSLHEEELLQPFRELADSIHGLCQPHLIKVPIKRNKTLAIMQLNHPGRQSSNFIGGRRPFQPPLAPSAVPLVFGDTSSLASRLLNSVMFQKPRTMTEIDVIAVMDHFVKGAMLAHRTGFDGVQLHAAHGYLLAQFLSKKTNKRNDIYSSDNALEMVRHICQRIRESTADNFAICIKLNAADYIPIESPMSKSLNEGEVRALTHLVTMASWGLIDVIEISGGDYEKPDFMTCSPRQAFFARFSHMALQSLDSLRDAIRHSLPLVLLTGGLRTPSLLSSALASRHADLLGIGRSSVLCPSLPSVLLERLKDPQRWDNIPFQPEPELYEYRFLECSPLSCLWNLVPKIKLIGAGVKMAWYIVAMRRIAVSPALCTTVDIPLNSRLGGLQSVLWMWVWTPGWQRSTYRLSTLSSTFIVTVIAYILYIKKLDHSQV